jgi:methanogenic corrinoid protein MtbC1
MSVADEGDDLFQHDVYEQSYSEISNLKARLPEDAVKSLAREVLGRLAEHFKATAIGAPLSESFVEELTEALISDDPKQAARLITKEQKISLRDERHYVSVLAAAARRLGDWWNLDRITFAQVTIGSGRIYAILRGLKPVLANAPVTLNGKAALFATVPGEDHTLGVRMASDMLREEGWEIDLALGLNHEELVERVAKSDHVIIGLSAGGVHSLPNLARLVVAIRLWAPKALVLVSGQVVEEARDTVELMAPNAMAAKFENAHAELERLWDLAITPDTV